MSVAPGTRLGPHEILAPIGAGGMGDVWKTRDTRLDRTVALKISKAEFSERFTREARAIAALNHPHICMLYDVGPELPGHGICWISTCIQLISQLSFIDSARNS
jgi:serine/threonine protein kinase